MFDGGPETKNEKIIYERWRKSGFKWTPENTKRIIEVINGIDKKVNQMYDAVLKTKKFLDAQNIPDAVKKYFYSPKESSFKRNNFIGISYTPSSS